MNLIETAPEQGTARLGDVAPWCLGCGNRVRMNAAGNLACTEPTCPEFWVEVDPALSTGCESCE